METSFSSGRILLTGRPTLDSGSGEEYKSPNNVASRNWAVLLLLVAAGGCSGSTSTVIIESNGDASFQVTGDHPPLEGEVRDGEIHGITPTPAPITPVSAMETPVPTPTPRQR